jgi:hypothetical protein
MGIVYPHQHAPFQTIGSADWDRHLEFLREAITLDAVGVRGLLAGKIQLAELDPALQALILNNSIATEVEESFLGDAIATVFTLLSTPILNTEEVFLNGVLQIRGTDYTIAAAAITFTGGAPAIGDVIFVQYKSVQSIAIINLGSFQLPYRQIFEALPTPSAVEQHIFTYGINKSSGIQEVAKFEAIKLTQLGTAVDVNGGTPDNSSIVFTSDGVDQWLWAVGSATNAHEISRINIATMAASTLAMNDPATVVAAIDTDGANIYAFMKGGATLQANSVQKINAVTQAFEAVFGPGIPNITSTGTVDMAVSLAGALYVSYSDVNASGSGEVRKFDVATGVLLKTFTATDFGVANARPIRIVPVLSDIYVLDDLNNKMFKLSATDGVTDIVTFGFAPDNMEFDNSDLWISSGQTLYKVDKVGTILNSQNPQPGKDIGDIVSGLGLIWTTYSDDTIVTDFNITKIHPGLPGVA